MEYRQVVRMTIIFVFVVVRAKIRAIVLSNIKRCFSVYCMIYTYGFAIHVYHNLRLSRG